MKNEQPETLAADLAAPKRLTLEAVFQEKIFEATSLRDPQWLKDSLRFSYLDKAPNSDITTVWIYEIRSGERRPVLDAAALQFRQGETQNVEAHPQAEDEDEEDAPTGDGKSAHLVINGYQWSPDETQILFAHHPRRRASYGDKALYVYSLATRKLRRVTKAPGEYRNAKWSPDGKRIGYVRADDLYLLDLATGKETRLTNTATPTIYNGRFGWVYEEELEIADGWAFKPDGKQIAYFQIDETPVPEIDLPNYDDLHMKPVRTRYPKAGDPNPRVKIGLIALHPESAAVPPTQWVDLGPDPDIDIARMQWTPQGTLLLQRLPRLQNRVDLLKVNPATGASTVILTEADKAWVDVPGDLTFIGNTGEFVWPSDRSGYLHYYLYASDGKLIRPLTEGAWEVDSVAGVDAMHRMLFFTAARPTPMERQLYSVLLDGGGDIIRLTDAPGTNKALFSPDGQHYLNTHSSRTSPPRVKLHRASGRTVAEVHSNPMPKLEGHQLGEWEFMNFKTSDGVTLNAALLRPADFDPNRK